MIADETDWVPRAVAEREAARADRAEAKAARLMARLDKLNPEGVQVYRDGRYVGSLGVAEGLGQAIDFLVRSRRPGEAHDLILKHHGEPLATIRDTPGGPVVEWAEGAGPGQGGGRP